MVFLMIQNSGSKFFQTSPAHEVVAAAVARLSRTIAVVSLNLTPKYIMAAHLLAPVESEPCVVVVECTR
jgi:phage terminase large subunit-like protein